MIKAVVLATRNPSKVERYRRLLAGLAEEVLSLADFSTVTGKPQETGETAEQNAQIKAIFYSARVGLPVFSEDEALLVDFLPPEQQPGVHVRRINGRDEANDDALLTHWERIVADVPEDQRTGHWHIAYCLAWPDGQVHLVSHDHPIKFFSPTSKVRQPGWPMSSLEGPVRFGKPLSELMPEERAEYDAEVDRVVLDKFSQLITV